MSAKIPRAKVPFAALPGHGFDDVSTSRWVIHNWRASSLLPALIKDVVSSAQVTKIIGYSDPSHFIELLQRRCRITLNQCRLLVHGTTTDMTGYGLTPADARIAQSYMDDVDASLLGHPSMRDASAQWHDMHSRCMGAADLQNRVRAWIYSNCETASARRYLRCFLTLHFDGAETVAKLNSRHRCKFWRILSGATFNDQSRWDDRA